MDFSTQANTARRLLEMRGLRWDYFTSDLFDENGWNILLILFVAHAERRPMSAVKTAADSGASAASGVRWINHLEAERLITRDADAVTLTDAARAEMAEYLTEVAKLFADDPAATLAARQAERG